MCEIIILKNGNEIETVEELEKYFGKNAEPYKNKYYNRLSRDGCLCQIDLDEFFKDKKYKIKHDGANWWEI